MTETHDTTQGTPLQADSSDSPVRREALYEMVWSEPMLRVAAVEIARLVEEGERQAEIERQRWEVQREQWRREEEARRAAKALKDSKEELLQIIDTWAEAKRLEEFFADAERRAQDLPDEERERTIERLRRARALIGSTHALERFGAWRAPEEL